MQYIRNYNPNPDRDRAYKIAFTVTLIGNLILVVGKVVGTYFTQSAALYADTANSISDLIYSIAMVIGLWIAIQPPDLTHPQGHARFEPVVGLVLSLMMTIAGYEALRNAIDRFFSGAQPIQFDLPTIILLGSAAIKTGMYLIVRKLALQTESISLRIAAQDNLSDILTSFAAFIGIIGSTLIHPLFDPIAGVLVSLWIFRAAFRAGKENISFLTGAGANAEVREKIIQTAKGVSGVQNVHHMMTDYVGPKLLVDMHINLPNESSLEEVHAVEDAVIAALQALHEVDRAYVHVEPLGED
jgi:cation diffusion facilitator family transporter